MYTPSQVADLFKVARETVRKWAMEFEDHLSPTANAGAGRQRSFVDSDLEVFALVVEMKGQGRLYADIHAALSNGQRGQPPAQVHALTPADTARPTQLQARANFLETQLKAALESEQRKDAQIDLLTEQLEAAQAEIRRIDRENAVLKYRLENTDPPK